MEALLTPAFGTVVWSTIAFLVVMFLLRKMAWGPILTALNEREESIATALNEADKARSEMTALQADNDRLLQEARAERDAMLREAREMADKVVAEAKAKAKDEASREAENARQAIATAPATPADCRVVHRGKNPANSQSHRSGDRAYLAVVRMLCADFAPAGLFLLPCFAASLSTIAAGSSPAKIRLASARLYPE